MWLSFSPVGAVAHLPSHPRIFISSDESRTDMSARSEASAHGLLTPSAGASRLAYDRTGQGEPLILLHGQGLSRRSWDPVIAALSAERDVIAVDLPGHGESARQPEGYGNAPAD